MQVIVIEDDVPIRNIMQLIVESAFPKACVVEAGTGTDALEIARRNPPDLVLLDLGLPDMSGLDVLASLQTMGTDARVVIITAEDLPDRRSRACELGAAAFVTKPFDVRRLRDLLQNIMFQGQLVDEEELSVFA